MADTFDKFSWLKALQCDPTVTEKSFRLGVVIATHYTKRDGSGWAVDLDEMADQVKGGMSVARFNDAVRHLASRGYVIETWRSVGGRPRKGVAASRRGAFNLTMPTETDAAVSVGSNGNRRRQRPKPKLPAVKTDAASDDYRRSGERQFGPVDPDQTVEISPTGTSSGTPSGTCVGDARVNGMSQTQRLPAIPDTTPITVEVQEVITVLGEVVEDDPDPEPPLECRDHAALPIDVRRPRCHDCRRVRQANQPAHHDWRLRQMLRETTAAASVGHASSPPSGPCAKCGGSGWIDLDEYHQDACSCRRRRGAP
ncbi:hypothetical protein [Mycolicibacterium thermoresistibile]|uniref:hypothetical protein n=1 Tax=Mycolicibacterium thermoresistibile TaxID=1797 RepID=UPI000B94AFFB|nr:hypothetical protein [Mycolicibacterium thermoresistibile]MCV7190846.1 hypothetical protein [Mycolicibacterium thermoresistibile]SNW18698.1 Uncharacterised protein [Mycolicibacterium thermoresistibile]